MVSEMVATAFQVYKEIPHRCGC